MTFNDLGLREEILQAIGEIGFETPTPIQEKSIPVLLSGTKDFIGLAQTGTGKTAAFGLPLLSLIDTQARHAQALIICPTRELCIQILKDLVRFKQYLPNCFITSVYGGTSISGQIRDLKKGVCAVVATPGRLIDLIERNAINLEEIQYVVLDEADEMLNMGFQEDIEYILRNTPNRNATWLFSATMPPEIRRVSKKYMKDPYELAVSPVNTTNENIDHQYYTVGEKFRYETLKRLIDFNPGIYGIIFTRTKADADEIAEKLTRDGYDIEALHGDLNQNQRDKVMNAFRRKELQLLIATDVAARGIDVKGVSHVINYQLPDDIEVYTHRSGRTGRAGLTGICMSIVNPREVSKIRAIEKIVKAKFNNVEIPTGHDVCRKQFLSYMDKIHNADISSNTYKSYLPLLQERFADMDRDEILTRVAALEFDRFVKYYENSIDLNQREQVAPKSKEKEGNRSSGNNIRFFINLGSKDGFDKKGLAHFIMDLADIPGKDIGDIFIQDLFSFVEVSPHSSIAVLEGLDGNRFKGRKIRMNEAERRAGQEVSKRSGGGRSSGRNSSSIKDKDGRSSKDVRSSRASDDGDRRKKRK